MRFLMHETISNEIVFLTKLLTFEGVLLFSFSIKFLSFTPHIFHRTDQESTTVTNIPAVETRHVIHLRSV